MGMRLAFLADIHSNLPALEAVVADLRDQAPDAIYLVGDQVNRCPWPNEVMDLLAAKGWPAILGNHDWVVGRIHRPELPAFFANRQRFRSMWWTGETLAPHHLDTLRALPAELRIDVADGPPIRLLHGIPGNSFVGLYPEASDETLLAQVQAVAEPVIVSGHTHRPLARRVGRWQLFNGGSIGLPYNEDPRAQYLLLDSATRKGERVWKPDFRRVGYDRDLLRPAFDRSGMMAATGVMGELHLRTALTGHAYSSDFAVWLRRQPAELQADLDQAVPLYLAQHGPGKWAFSI